MTQTIEAHQQDPQDQPSDGEELTRELEKMVEESRQHTDEGSPKPDTAPIVPASPLEKDGAAGQAVAKGKEIELAKGKELERAKGQEIEPAAGTAVEVYGQDNPPPTEQLPEQTGNALEKVEPIRVGLHDVHESQRALAEHLAGQELRAHKAEVDRQRADMIERHPKLGKNIVGRALLNVIQTTRHPVETIWRQNIAKEYFRQKEIYSFLHGEKRDQLAVAESEQQATLDRMAAAQDASERGDDVERDTFLHAGERLIEEDTPEVTAFKGSLNELLKEYATGTMSREDFAEAKERLIVEQASWIHQSKGKNGERFIDTVDSISQAAEQLRTVFEHTRSVESIDEQLANLQLVTGEAKIGERTTTKAEKIDKIIEKLSGTKIGTVVNEQTLAVAVAAAGIITARSATSVASKALRVATFGLAGAAISGFGVYKRERMTMRQERAAVARELAGGEQQADDRLELTPVREKLTEVAGEMRSSSEIMQQFQALQEILPDDDEVSLTPEQASLIYSQVVDLHAMVRFGDAEERDLIQYSSRDRIDAERLEIDTQLMNYTQLLREHYMVDHPEQLPDGLDFNTFLRQGIDQAIEQKYEKAAEAQDASFEKFSKDRALKRAALTVASGVLAGVAIREFTELGTSHTRIPGTEVTRPMPNKTENLFGSSYSYPKEWKFDAGSGQMLDVRTGAVVASGLKVDTKTGAFDAATIDMLRGKGFAVKTESITVAGPPTEVHMNVDMAAGGMPRVQRLWMENNTPKFDLNELRADWKVEGDSLVIDMRRMTAGGSFHNGQAVNPSEMFAQGQSKLLFSLDKAHQSQPFQMNIQPDGMVRIPVNSSEARNLFDLSTGEPQLKAAFMEVATPRGVSPTGAEQYSILATAVGRNDISDIGIYDIPTEVTVSRNVIEATTTAIEGGSDATVKFPIFLPLPLSRFGLENRVPGQPGANGVEVVETGPPDDTNQPPVDVPPPVPGNGNKAFEINTDIPIDEAWRQQWTAVGQRITDEDMNQEDFWTANMAGGADVPRRTGVLEPGPGDVPIAAIPERSPLFHDFKNSQEVATLAGNMLERAELLDQVPDLGALTDRLTRGIYSHSDLARLTTLLSIAQDRIENTTDQYRFSYSRQISSMLEYLGELEARYDAQNIDQLSLLYEGVGEVRKAISLGLEIDSTHSVYGRFGNMIQRTQRGEKLEEWEYNWLTGIFAIASRNAETVIQQGRSRSGNDGLAEERLQRIRETLSTRMQAIARLKTLALGTESAPQAT